MTHASTQHLEPWSIDPREIEVCRNERGPIRLGHGGYGAVRSGFMVWCGSSAQAWQSAHRLTGSAAHRPARLRCSSQGPVGLHARDRLAFCCQATACSSLALPHNFTMRGLRPESAHKNLSAGVFRAVLLIWVALLRQLQVWVLELRLATRCSTLPVMTPAEA